MATADRESQQVFDSIEHIGHFKGGGGVAGCTRWFVLPGDVDVLQHYRAALPAAGWEVVEDDGRHLRAQLDGRAFDVMPCPGGGVIWAGSDDDRSYGQGGLSWRALKFVHTTSEKRGKTLAFCLSCRCAH